MIIDRSLVDRIAAAMLAESDPDKRFTRLVMSDATMAEALAALAFRRVVCRMPWRADDAGRGVASRHAVKRDGLYMAYALDAVRERLAVGDVLGIREHGPAWAAAQRRATKLETATARDQWDRWDVAIPPAPRVLCSDDDGAWIQAWVFVEGVQ